MHTSNFLKGIVSLNPAIVIRALRFGIRDAVQKSRESYRTINPFQSINSYKKMLLNKNSAAFDSIPEISLDAIMRSIPRISLEGSCRTVDGALPLQDLIALLCLIRDRDPRTILEIGTYYGMTTRLMAINLPEAIIHTVDLPEDFEPSNDVASIQKDDFHLIRKRKVGEYFKLDSSISNIVQHFGDTSSWDFRTVGTTEFFFIDGSHTYDYVKNDTNKCLSDISNHQATFLWHDCDPAHPGVVRWLAEMIESGYPVKRIAGTNLAILDLHR